MTKEDVAEIITYCEEQKVSYTEDAEGEDDAYKRDADRIARSRR